MTTPIDSGQTITPNSNSEILLPPEPPPSSIDSTTPTSLDAEATKLQVTYNVLGIAIKETERTVGNIVNVQA